MSLAERALAIDTILTPPLVIPERCKPARAAALVLAHTGDSVVWVVLLGLVWLLGDAAWKGRAPVALAGVVLVELLAFGIKFLFRRPRPAGRSGMIYRKIDPYSFPSGHAARAAMLMVFFAVSYPSWCIAAGAVWGLAMVFARIAIGLHYVLDVVGGAALGAGLAWVMLALVPVVAAIL